MDGGGIEVQPPEGRTPGDLRAMLVTLKPFLAQEWDEEIDGGKRRLLFLLVMCKLCDVYF